jgi:hypothetical protein
MTLYASLRGEGADASDDDDDTVRLKSRSMYSDGDAGGDAPAARGETLVVVVLVSDALLVPTLVLAVTSERVLGVHT